MVPDQWKFLYGLNPLVGAIEGLRWALYGTSTNLLSILPGGLIIALAAMLIGLIHFRKTEEYFADFV
jgi:lipopolysaccharide transport system permease protein